METENIIIAKHFIAATQEVLQTMAGLSVETGTPFVKTKNPQEGDISAVIGVTGDRKGTISVSFSRSAAKVLLNGMLGDDVQDEEQDMKDVVGEIANIVSGKARATLTDDELLLHGSTPTIVTGDGHTINHKASGRTVAIPFGLDGSAFTVEFCFDSASDS